MPSKSMLLLYKLPSAMSTPVTSTTVAVSSASQSNARITRSARFRADSNKPPPPLPIGRIAHPGGRMVTNDKHECLRKLLQRKLDHRQALTSDQLRAQRALGESDKRALTRGPASPGL